MERSQIYIGCPNGIVLCINSRSENSIGGEFFHSYSRESIPFQDLQEAVLKIDRFYEKLGFPQRGNKERRFSGASGDVRREEMIKVMNDEELLKKHGDYGTFIVRVQHCQNCSWQGQVVWVDKKETLYFRSALELIKMIDAAVNANEKEEE